MRCSEKYKLFHTDQLRVGSFFEPILNTVLVKEESVATKFILGVASEGWRPIGIISITDDFLGQILDKFTDETHIDTQFTDFKICQAVIFHDSEKPGFGFLIVGAADFVFFKNGRGDFHGIGLEK
jgi:hypothetical protein